MVVFNSITEELITDILPTYELSEEALAYIKRVSKTFHESSDFPARLTDRVFLFRPSSTPCPAAS